MAVSLLRRVTLTGFYEKQIQLYTAITTPLPLFRFLVIIAIRIFDNLNSATNKTVFLENYIFNSAIVN